MATGIGSLAVQITGSTTGLSASLKDASTQLKGFQNKTDKGGEFKGMGLKVGDNLKAQISPVQVAMGNLISMATEFGIRLAASVASGLKDLVSESVKLAANMESTMTSFEVLLGDAGKAKSLYADLQDLAKRTPLTQSQVNDTAKVLLGSGTKKEQIVPMTEMLGNFASESASVKELAILMAQVKGKGQLYAEEAQQFAEKGIMIFPLLAKAYGKSETEMRAMVTDRKVSSPMLQKAMFEATQAGGQFYKMLDKQGQTFNGLQSTLEDTLKQSAAGFGKILIEELDLKGLMKEITGTFETVSGDGSGLRNFVKEFKPIVWDFVRMIPDLLQAAKWLMEFVTPAIKFAADLKAAVDRFGEYVFAFADEKKTAMPGGGDFATDKGIGNFLDEADIGNGIKDAFRPDAEMLNQDQIAKAKSISEDYDPIAAQKDRVAELMKMRDLGAFKDQPDKFAFAVAKVMQPTLKEFGGDAQKMGINAGKGSVEAASIIAASAQRDSEGGLQERVAAAAEASRILQAEMRDSLRMVYDAMKNLQLLGVK